MGEEPGQKEIAAPRLRFGQAADDRLDGILLVDLAEHLAGRRLAMDGLAVVGDRAIVIARVDPGVGPAGVGRGKIGRQADGIVITGNGRVGHAELVEQPGPEEMGRHQFWSLRMAASQSSLAFDWSPRWSQATARL